jgi:anti-sigma regulatory factor (Ser/Thr protein kinase)
LSELTFSNLDGVTFAASRGRLSSIENSVRFKARDLGPLLELYHFSANNMLPKISELSWLDCSGLSAFAAMIGARNKWISPEGGRIGFLKPKISDTENDWNVFAIAAHKASLAAGITSDATAQLIGALGEMRSNLYEHSEAVESSLIAFRAAPNSFEFTVSDHGIGALHSLKSCGHYKSITDNGEALRLMLTDNVSRFGPDSDRGKGFRPLFIGLANMNGTIRFRSGDHSLMIHGDKPSLVSAKTAQKAELKGFFASIYCRKL